MERLPKPNEIYRHFKGNLYRVLTLARQTETEELLVVYQALYGDFEVFARPLSMFTGEVDHVKYPDIPQKYRFEKIPEGMEGTQRAEVPEGMEGTQRVKTPEGMEFSEVSGESGNAVQNGVTQIKAREDEADSKAAEKEMRRKEAGFTEEQRTALLMDFLDADTYEDKLDSLAAMRDKLDDEMISTMAMALDVEVEEGALEERYQSLKNCLLMLDRFECSRLR